MKAFENYENNSEPQELKCYLRIIEFFQKSKSKAEDTEIWKNKVMVTLMNLLKQKENQEILVRNALILLLSLFEDLPPDIYNAKGQNFKKVDQKQKASILDQLKEEFLPN